MSLKTLQNFYKTTISQDWATGTGNFYVTTKPVPTTGWLVVSPSSSILREIIFYTAAGTDSTGDYITISSGGRGLGGTTEQAHIIGETVKMNITSLHIAEIDTDKPSISSGAVAPATTPGKVGDVYIDTVAKKQYTATGTSSSADWTILN